MGEAGSEGGEVGLVGRPDASKLGVRARTEAAIIRFSKLIGVDAGQP